MSDQNQVESLIQGYQKRDPRLYDILRMLAGTIESVRILVNEALTPETVIAEDPTLPLPASITYSLPGDSLKISWSDVDAFGDLLSAVSNFELRKGTVWTTASLEVRTTSLSVNLAPDLATGTHTYLLKTINSSGGYSVNYLTLVVTIGAVSAVGITTTVIDNNVLLYWTKPVSSSFNIDRYEITRSAVLLGTSYGTFLSYFESAAGTFTYGIKAYDLAGNVSAETFIDVTVSAPPDFELVALQLSTFTGTCTKCIVDAGQLIAPVFTAETWAEHFTNNSVDQIQDFIDAGFGPWLTPSESTAEYQEEFDFGLIISGALINVAWAAQQFHADLVSVSCAIEASDDGATWSAAIAGTSAYFATCRYARVTLTFTPASTKSLVALSNLTCSVDIKYAVDSGEVTADKTDASGTTVTFNKAFKDVNSITLTVFAIEPITAIYDFTDVPNPTGFYVFAFDTFGTRITYPVSWKARGII